jgi:hypothetical protein
VLLNRSVVHPDNDNVAGKGLHGRCWWSGAVAVVGCSKPQ